MTGIVIDIGIALGRKPFSHRVSLQTFSSGKVLFESVAAFVVLNRCGLGDFRISSSRISGAQSPVVCVDCVGGAGARQLEKKDQT